MTRGGRGLAVLSATACLALAACNGAPEVEATPSPTPSLTEIAVTSPSPTPSPTTTALTEEEVLAAIPEEARSEDFPGAVSFAEFFLIESQDVFVHQDIRLLKALSLPGCVYCENTVEAVQTMVDDGVTARGSKLTAATGAAQGGEQPDATWRVVMDVEISESDIFDDNERLIDTRAPQQATLTVVLELQGSGWRVVDVASQQA
ncbi:DUF6318 family protein [Demequina sp. NBRC 110053]|uniref:DUF6318 family protein n=1 Tax=Demequina sp. NBRC 110053 TaxID=1570342 RepID=UPI0011868FBF|nr:DUF6318 family protein [Demequina sp. NBRC 110053]